MESRIRAIQGDIEFAVSTQTGSSETRALCPRPLRQNRNLSCIFSADLQVAWNRRFGESHGFSREKHLIGMYQVELSHISTSIELNARPSACSVFTSSGGKTLNSRIQRYSIRSFPAGSLLFRCRGEGTSSCIAIYSIA